MWNLLLQFALEHSECFCYRLCQNPLEALAHTALEPSGAFCSSPLRNLLEPLMQCHPEASGTFCPTLLPLNLRNPWLHSTPEPSRNFSSTRCRTFQKHFLRSPATTFQSFILNLDWDFLELVGLGCTRTCWNPVAAVGENSLGSRREYHSFFQRLEDSMPPKIAQEDRRGSFKSY